MNRNDLKFDHSTAVQLLFYAIIMICLWHMELIFRPESLKNKWRHTILNSQFIITALLIQLPLSILVFRMSQWSLMHHWGLLYKIPFSTHFLLKVLTGLILLDFFEYIYHVSMHKIGCLWSFHLVHHIDIKLDVSTTVREHPLETFVRVSFMIIAVYIIGAPVLILLIRQFIQSFSNIAAHTSLHLPKKAEKILKYLFITPDLHKVHHHYKLPYTDCNYGDILSIWDRLFGTYKELDQSKIIFGLDTANVNHINTFISLLKYPFKNTLRKNE